MNRIRAAVRAGDGVVWPADTKQPAHRISMCHSLHSPARRPVWRRGMLVLVVSGVLAGCANGDFGRVRPLLVRDEVHDWVGREAVEVKNIAPSEFQLTDDERLLRDLAYPLIEKPYQRQRPW